MGSGQRKMQSTFDHNAGWTPERKRGRKGDPAGRAQMAGSPKEGFGRSMGCL